MFILRIRERIIIIPHPVSCLPANVFPALDLYIESSTQDSHLVATWTGKGLSAHIRPIQISVIQSGSRFSSVGRASDSQIF